MKELLAIEWMKIRRYRTFWVLVGLFLLLMPIWNFEVAYGLINLGGGKQGVNFLNTAYSFPDVWSNVGFWGSIFVLFLSILVIIITTNEYTYKTNRQNVIDGWSRLGFYHAKVLLVFIISAIATAYVFLLGFIFGIINSGSAANVFSEIQQVGYFFLLSVNYLGFALFLSIWIKRSGLAIGLFLLYSFIIENIAKSIINHWTDLPVGNLMPLQASDELLPFPIMQMAKTMIGNGPSISMNVYALATMLWCLVYYYCGKMILVKRDW